jgi:Uma2 family endonuclease
MATEHQGKLSYAEFCLIPETNTRHELIAGFHYVAPSNWRNHQRAAGNLLLDLGRWVNDHRAGFLCHNLEVVLSEEDVVRPDLIFVCEERRSSLETEQGVTGAPDLIVEVLEDFSLELDQDLKLSLYEWAGVREYWVVDPVLEAVKVYRLNGGVYERVAELSAEAGDRLETPLLPGLAIAVARIFE